MSSEPWNQYKNRTFLPENATKMALAGRFQYTIFLRVLRN